MPAVYYSNYNTEDLSIPEATALEHDLGRKLLSLGLAKQYGLALLPESVEPLLSEDVNGKPCLPVHVEYEPAG